LIQLTRQIITLIFGKKQADDFFSGYVAKNSVQLFLMHCIALVLGFISNYVLIQVAGVNAYGSYVYIFNLLYLLMVFCIFGTDTLLIKKMGVYDKDSGHQHMKGVIIFSLIIAVAGSLLVSIISSLVIHFTEILDNRIDISWWLLAMVTLPMLSLMAVNQASLQGLKKMFFSQVTEKIMRPLLIIMTAVALFYIRGNISLGDLVWINVSVIAIAMLISFILLKKSIPYKLTGVQAKYDSAGWFKACIAFLFLDLLYMLNARIDIFLLGIYKTNKEVAVYNIALRISEVISFGLVIINFVLAPLVAKLFEDREMRKLQRLITRSARAVLLISLPSAILIIVFRQPILSFFQVNTVNGNLGLLILCFGQIINILSGSVGLLLVMTGHQKFSITSLLVGTVANIILNIILVPQYGLIGTAIATSASLVLWNLLMLVFVNRKLKIHATVFAVV
jgi:O-antigen/teichoic acid export membrane protein